MSGQFCTLAIFFIGNQKVQAMVHVFRKRYPLWDYNAISFVPVPVAVTLKVLSNPEYSWHHWFYWNFVKCPLRHDRHHSFWQTFESKMIGRLVMLTICAKIFRKCSFLTSPLYMQILVKNDSGLIKSHLHSEQMWESIVERDQVLPDWNFNSCLTLWIPVPLNLT